jgi:hypothetical protein
MNDSVYTDLPSASQTSDILTEVALNLRWSWNHSADQTLGAARSRQAINLTDFRPKASC